MAGLYGRLANAGVGSSDLGPDIVTQRSVIGWLGYVPLIHWLLVRVVVVVRHVPQTLSDPLQCLIYPSVVVLVSTVWEHRVMTCKEIDN